MHIEPSTAGLLRELDLFRRAHAGASRKAATAFELACRLRECRVWVPCDDALREIADRIFYNTSYDACERFESAVEFALELRPNVESVWNERDLIEGVECFVIRPVFAINNDYLQELGIGYLRGCAPVHLSALDVRPMRAFPAEAIAGLSTAELEALVSYHRSSALTLVNHMRHLETALCYVRSALSKGLTLNKKPLVHDMEMGGLAERLANSVALGFSPPTSKHFGTDADRTNPLRSLDADGGALATLLAA